MSRRLLLLALVFSIAADAAPARAEVIPGPRPLASGDIAFGTNGAGAIAVAYESRRGLVVAVSPRGGRFRRAVRIARLARGERYDNDLAVTVGMGGDVLVVWDRFDGTEPAEDDTRDEGCCTRVHAARITPGGRRLPTQVLTPAGTAAWHGDTALSRGGRAAVTWIQERGGDPWRARIAGRRGRFGSPRTFEASYGGDYGFAAFAGSVLRALYFKGRSLYERRGRARPRRIARRIAEYGETLAARDAAGRLLLVRQDRLIAVPASGQARVRYVPRRRNRDLRVASNAAGRVALTYLPGFGRRASRRLHVRLGTIAGDLGAPRRVLSGKTSISWTQSKAAVSPVGDAALFAMGEWIPRRRHRGFYLARIPRFGTGSVRVQRIARVSAIGEFAGAAYDASGRPLAVVRDRGRNRVIRP